MKIIKFAVVTAIASVVFFLISGGAFAQAGRTFVSGQGADTGTCAVAAPCRSFAYAITQTASGGEIVVLSSAGYGSVTITEPLAITNPGGVDAGVTATSGAAITVNAGSGVVTLRGLIVEGLGSGQFGILFNTGAELDVQNCVLRGFTKAGLQFVPTASAVLTVSDTIASGNQAGFFFNPAGGAGTAVQGFFTRAQAIDNNDQGFFFQKDGASSAAAVVTDSATVRNSIGVYALGVAPVTLANSTAAFNGTGVFADEESTIFLQQSTISGNTTGYMLSFAGGTIKTFGNNAITDTNNSGSLVSVALQ